MINWLKKVLGVKENKIVVQEEIVIEEIEIISEEKQEAINFFTLIFEQAASKATDPSDQEYCKDVAKLLMRIYGLLKARREGVIEIWGNPSTTLGGFYWARLMEEQQHVALSSYARMVTDKEMSIVCEGIQPALIRVVKHNQTPAQE
ncbi:MAG: hypothetical protein WCI57_02410 [Candidatus Berkelbacteria bacterium]